MNKLLRLLLVLLRLLLVCALILTTAFASCKAPDDSTDDSTSNSTSNSTNNSSTDQTDDSYVPSIEYPLDFEVRVEAGRDVKILQLTDPQVFENDDALLQKKCFSIMDYVVEQTKPDLILVTGDIIYGRYDETGEIFTKIVNKFESYGVPWAPIFGNHDNESKKGTKWQCQTLENAQNCLFVKRSELSGNGNYSIGVFSGDDLIRTIYMLDTKGCTNIDGKYRQAPCNLDPSQKDFVVDSQAKAELYRGKKVEGFVCQHIMISFIANAVKSKYNVDLSNIKNFVLPTDQGDFGAFGQKFTPQIDKNGAYFYAFKDCGITGIFAGHEHLNDASVEYDGVRLTYGVKSSTCDSFDINMLGGTLIKVNADGFSVKNVYFPPDDLQL